MDPISTAAIGAASKTVDPAAAEGAKVGAQLFLRLLGPSADVLGAHWADRLREKNIARLLAKTEHRAIRSGESGIASPRVASKVFQDAEFADDEMVAEYLSGVLSSSRSEDGTYDGGVEWSSLIARLSSDQLRLHYLIYASARQVLAEAAVEQRANWLHMKRVILPQQELMKRMGEGLSAVRFSNAVNGLMREGLIAETYAYGPNKGVAESDFPKGSGLDVPYDRSLKVGVSIQGMRLYMWGLGMGHLALDLYIDPDLAITTVDEQPELMLLDGVVMLEDVLLDPEGNKFSKESF